MRPPGRIPARGDVQGTVRRPDRKLLINFVTAFDPLTREARLNRPAGPGSAFEPPTDLYETDDALVVRMEIAGMTADAISLSLDESTGRLTISGSRSQAPDGSRRRFYSAEVAFGPFARRGVWGGVRARAFHCFRIGVIAVCARAYG